MGMSTSTHLSTTESAEAERLLREVHAASYVGADITEHHDALPPLGSVTVAVRRGHVAVTKDEDRPGVLRIQQKTTTWCPASAQTTSCSLFDYRGRPLPGAPSSDVLRVLGTERASEDSDVTLSDGSTAAQRTTILRVRAEVPVIADRAEDITVLACDRLSGVLSDWDVAGLRSGEVETDDGVSRQGVEFRVFHGASHYAGVFDCITRLRGAHIAGVGVVESAGRLDSYSLDGPVSSERQHIVRGANSATIGRIVVRWRSEVGS